MATVRQRNTMTEGSAQQKSFCTDESSFLYDEEEMFFSPDRQHVIKDN